MSKKTKKIALLGDVHANLPALEAVITHAQNLGVETFWNIGDFVGYGAFPNEVVKRMRKKNFVSIIGNYDLKVLNFPLKDDNWREKKHPLKYLAFKWAYENLSPKSLEFLRSLPEERQLKTRQLNFLLVHGSPVSNEELLEPGTPERRLLELKTLVKEKFSTDFAAIICGHSHQPFTRRIENTLFINTGSVGRPDDGSPRAAYAILQIDKNGLHAFHYRLNYDVDDAVAAIRRKNLPEAFAKMMHQGRDLETVLKN
ncbi:MAG: metallophosphoesterase family protein [Chloroflexota bacterium]|nr:MAG: metallophosphoesterase family protein [Chloroflexota bacterium]